MSLLFLTACSASSDGTALAFPCCFPKRMPRRSNANASIVDRTHQETQTERERIGDGDTRGETREKEERRRRLSEETPSTPRARARQFHSCLSCLCLSLSLIIFSPLRDSLFVISLFFWCCYCYLSLYCLQRSYILSAMPPRRSRQPRGTILSPPLFLLLLLLPFFSSSFFLFFSFSGYILHNLFPFCGLDVWQCVSQGLPVYRVSSFFSHLYTIHR